MKNVLGAALAATISTATFATADVTYVPPSLPSLDSIYDNGWEFFGIAEYSWEADRIDGVVGTSYSFDNSPISMFSTMNLEKLDGETVDITTMDLGGQYAFNNNVGGYVVVKFDDNFDYDEVTTGIAFKF